MSQWRLHQESGVSTSYIDKLEKGKNEPKPDILRRMANPLKISYYDLLEKAGHIKKEELVQWLEINPNDPDVVTVTEAFKKMTDEKKRHWLAILSGG